MAMAGPGSEPSWRLPVQADPAGQGGRRVKPVHAVLASLLALALLCCGGTAAVALFRGGDKKPAAGAETIQATTAPPTETTAPTTRATKGTVATHTPTRKPSPRQTTHKPTPKPTTRKPTPPPTTTAPPGPIVHPGAFCAPVGAIGYTIKGKLMRCTRKDGEDRARWRAA